ncbi:ATP-dependent Clp protease ATP-binding subunit CLPT2, chloroplastic-like isoform X2 [Cannabis sativa]|uniref:ATP-dependent Clp protease ATP-binding subunit CLPT2, chloroplastic-like isoform X2 n=1 Tax=Cannabis sativa TaxID=3483 RepID=UPI0029CA410E|nr:ATP-dependent Clp protease ATP-binding subunit CLPT2, chloroplastic-like isoform X2 [Cannabis sativa]
MAAVNASLLSKLPTAAIGRTPETYSPSPNVTFRPRTLLSSWLGTKSFSLQSSSLRPRPLKVRLAAATVSLSLPTAKPETVSSPESIPKWSSRAIKSFGMSELEARKLKFSTTGTEALLMGILVEGTSLAAKFLRASGITLTKVREEAIKLVGKADMFYFSPEHPPLTEEAQRVLDWAIDQKIKSGDGGETTTSYLLLGIWLEANSPGHKILATLGFNDEKVKQLETLLSEPGVDDD